jgi:hypothetical protein
MLVRLIVRYIYLLDVSYKYVHVYIVHHIPVSFTPIWHILLALSIFVGNKSQKAKAGGSNEHTTSTCHCTQPNAPNAMQCNAMQTYPIQPSIKDGRVPG